MRRFILSLLGVAALAIAAIAILPSLISSDWVRSELGRQLSAATGSSIAFNGPVNLSAFPYLAVVAEDVTLSAEAEGITAEFAEVSGSVALSSLWSDRLHIKQIALDRPVIVLEEKAADEATLTTAGSGHETGSGDPLPALVAFLERSAIESVSIASGTFILRSATNRDEVVSDIALTLSAPDIDDEFSLSASARMGERNYETSFTISTLRSLLERQPADVTVTAEADPAPAPGLTNFEASGQLTLNANGSYQIRGGEVETGEQVFGLNALFVPGERALSCRPRSRPARPDAVHGCHAGNVAVGSAGRGHGQAGEFAVSGRLRRRYEHQRGRFDPWRNFSVGRFLFGRTQGRKTDG
ncbi:AsmA family protein (plasmid) [Sinorhizobium meliloti]|nr:AsmA family protein [Sinorhizobium meliloti]